ISLAHNGILFADELPEFNKKTLEVLRQPLEDHRITISRATYNTDYPCKFMFVASMNPCPCGYYNDPTHECSCTPGQIKRYLGKISGPLLDRIDLQIECTNVKFNDLARMQPGEPSRDIRARVVAAREIQTRRFAADKGIYCNAQMNERLIRTHVQLAADAMNVLKTAMEKFNLSARAYSRILKVARTIADLDKSETVEKHHIQEAVLYRSLDRNYWGEY
ncbi:MAG: ATP-binding protein, partial [Bacteroidaceae bacterium]|nr:ATP-binding protein [Bacteroidaceae bacterium]